MIIAVSLAVFLGAYLLNILTITIGYHRGLAHGAVRLHPRLQRLLVAGGNWVTGLDPKAWVVMHRLHHAHSDTPLDPHSPVNVGLLGIGMAQLRSYERVIRGLRREDPELMALSRDLDFELSWLNRSGRWYLPYLLHAVLGAGLAGLVAWPIGLAYFLGMMSHPFQGGMVNALGHAVGGRNFETNDNSRNNLLAAWLIAGEGLQNNHHRFPKSAKFSYRTWEPDLGFAFCLLFETCGLLTIDHRRIIPTPPSHVARAEESL